MSVSHRSRAEAVRSLSAWLAFALVVAVVTIVGAHHHQEAFPSEGVDASAVAVHGGHGAHVHGDAAPFHSTISGYGGQSGAGEHSGAHPSGHMAGRRSGLAVVAAAARGWVGGELAWVAGLALLGWVRSRGRRGPPPGPVRGSVWVLLGPSLAQLCLRRV